MFLKQSIETQMPHFMKNDIKNNVKPTFHRHESQLQFPTRTVFVVLKEAPVTLFRLGKFLKKPFINYLKKTQIKKIHIKETIIMPSYQEIPRTKINS